MAYEILKCHLKLFLENNWFIINNNNTNKGLVKYTFVSIEM